ncbi:dihydroorotase [Patescibacteria group bacterium]|nr:dihydroorotase [Patescibacteria group bacterium]
MADILIKRGRVIDPEQGIDEQLDVLIRNGKVQKLRKRINEKKAQVVDARGLIVTPGFIDLHVHLREPGREDKETIKTCSEAAAAGGFTTIVGMPNTSPVSDNQTVPEFVAAKAAREAVVDVRVVGSITQGLSGEAISEMDDLKKAGIVGISDDGFDVKNASLMRDAMEYAAMLDLPIISHSEDMSFKEAWAMNEGVMSTKLGLPGKPAASEEIAISRNIMIAAITGATLHCSHINTKRAVQLVYEGRKKGVNVTCDTCPHFFTLDESYLVDYDANYKMNPPLREKTEVSALKTYLRNGIIDAITSDHAPHLLVDKMVEFEHCENGIVGLETSVGLVLTHLVKERFISLTRMVELMSVNPAKILGFKEKGSLKEGNDGDITLIDENKNWTVDKSTFKSKGRNTPFDGWELSGKAVGVVSQGKYIQNN